MSTPDEASASYYNFEYYAPSVTQLQRALFKGETLRVGDKAPLFSLPSVDGDALDLQQLLSTGHVAIIFGSYSAPPCVIEMPGIEAVYRSLAPSGWTFVFVYTREIHPHELLEPHNKVFPPHLSLEQKTDHARAFRDDLGLTLPVAVDDLSGSVHNLYGGLPFSQAVIHQDGTLIHRADWGDADLLATIGANLHRNAVRTQEGMPSRYRSTAFTETLWYR